MLAACPFAWGGERRGEFEFDVGVVVALDGFADLRAVDSFVFGFCGFFNALARDERALRGWDSEGVGIQHSFDAAWRGR